MGQLFMGFTVALPSFGFRSLLLPVSLCLSLGRKRAFLLLSLCEGKLSFSFLLVPSLTDAPLLLSIGVAYLSLQLIRTRRARASRCRYGVLYDPLFRSSRSLNATSFLLQLDIVVSQWLILKFCLGYHPSCAVPWFVLTQAIDYKSFFLGLRSIFYFSYYFNIHLYYL